MRVHIVNAHLTYPNWSEGGLNTALAALAREHLERDGHEVSETKIEDGYDPEAEVATYLDADLVILQTPMNWFSAPWIFKRYIDEVFNAGLKSKELLDNDGRTRSDPDRQYGTGGHMHGRGFFVTHTWTAPRETFDNDDSVLFEGKTVDDVLLNITTNYRFVGFTVLENYGVFDIFHTDGADVGLRGYPAHLDRQIAALESVQDRSGALEAGAVR